MMGSDARVQVIKITFLLRSALTQFSVISSPKSGNRCKRLSEHNSLSLLLYCEWTVNETAFYCFEGTARIHSTRKKREKEKQSISQPKAKNIFYFSFFFFFQSRWKWGSWEHWKRKYKLYFFFSFVDARARALDWSQIFFFFVFFVCLCVKVKRSDALS